MRGWVVWFELQLTALRFRIKGMVFSVLVLVLSVFKTRRGDRRLILPQLGDLVRARFLSLAFAVLHFST